jgi:hypothetical protein
MDAILTFLLKAGSFLYKEKGCRIVDSLHSDSFGGDGIVVLQSEKVRVRFVYDRGQLFTDFQRIGSKSKDDWVSVDIVRHYLTGKPGNSSEMTAESTMFLKDRFEDIEQMFSNKSFASTLADLRSLEKERAAKMFVRVRAWTP